MLETIILRNFQCHTKRTINFSQHVTTLVGDSDEGKTAILRALGWVCRNEPAGTEFITHGETFCRVSLQVDGHRIVRRTGDQNTYKLDGKTYKAFGREVPSAIASLLNVTEENFQQQHDAPFWLALTPGQVSKELNRIINLGVIDGTLAELASQTRQAKTTVEVTRQRWQQAKQEKERLAWVPTMHAKLAHLEGLENEIALKRRDCRRIAEMCRGASECLATKETLSRGILVAHRANKSGERWATVVTRLEGCRKLVGAYKRQQELLCRTKKQLKNAQEELKKSLIGKCPICQSKLSPS